MGGKEKSNENSKENNKKVTSKSKNLEKTQKYLKETMEYDPPNLSDCVSTQKEETEKCCECNETLEAQNKCYSKKSISDQLKSSTVNNMKNKE